MVSGCGADDREFTLRDFCLQFSKTDTTGFSPFFLVHGRDIQTPLDVIFPHNMENEADNYPKHLVTRAEEATQLLKFIFSTLKQLTNGDITGGTDLSATKSVT